MGLVQTEYTIHSSGDDLPKVGDLMLDPGKNAFKISEVLWSSVDDNGRRTTTVNAAYVGRAIDTLTTYDFANAFHGRVSFQG